jgi:hypothetical protein
MESPPQPANAGLFLWEVDTLSTKGQKQRQTKILLLIFLWELQRKFGGKVVEQYLQSASEIIGRFKGAIPAGSLSDLQQALVSRAQEARPIVRAHLERAAMVLLRRETTQGLEAPDPVRLALGEFQVLDRAGQGKVARNLALLWENFRIVFGGLSGFMAAQQTDRIAFIEKLESASERMAPARGSEVAFHYVTVELMRQYVSCLHQRRSDQSAIALAQCVVTLIDQGRTMSPEGLVYQVRP